MLKRAKIVINFDTDEAVTFGKKLTLEKLSVGHYVLPFIMYCHLDQFIRK